jgi:signal transduction histidine kinase
MVFVAISAARNCQYCTTAHLAFCALLGVDASTSAGGMLTLTGQGTATHVQLTLHDTGSGIPAGQLARIFEPLYTTKPGGRA